MEETDVATQLAYLHLEEAELELLGLLEPLLERNADALVAAFYRHLLSFPRTRALLKDPQVKERLLSKQRAYLLSLARPSFDDVYVRDRRIIGEVHERLGLEPRWYLGAYALYFSILTPLICDECHDEPERGARTVVALQKLLTFDAAIAMEGYTERNRGEFEYLAQELALESRRLGQDFEDQTAELRRTRRRAREAEELASIATLVAGLAHEIGTPMGVIQGHAKLLESSVSDDAVWRLETIQEQVGRISRIIQTLLNMARPGPSRRVVVALEPLLETTLSFVSERLSRRKIEVVRHFAPVPSLNGDPERLQQLFLNLVLNAADAMCDGGTLTVTLTGTSDGEAEVRVADTGSGIPKQNLPHIFEPFFTSKPAGEGNGLGLMVAAGIAADHRGGIEVESAEGQGTEFRVHLPAEPVGD